MSPNIANNKSVDPSFSVVNPGPSGLLLVLKLCWGELRPLSSYCQTHGIVHKLICPHIHHQNGVVERKHRHIVELGMTLLKQTSLPTKFWDFSF